ncbi:hypothetical protein CYMTET_43816, partial [Cymbomonas tetramitiformis]
MPPKGKKAVEPEPEPEPEEPPRDIFPLVLISRLKHDLEAHTQGVQTIMFGVLDDTTYFSGGCDCRVVLGDCKTLEIKDSFGGPEEMGAVTALFITEELWQPPAAPEVEVPAKGKKPSAPAAKTAPIPIVTVTTATTKGYVHVWKLDGVKEAAELAAQQPPPAEGDEPPEPPPAPVWKICQTIPIGEDCTRAAVTCMINIEKMVITAGRDHHIRVWHVALPEPPAPPEGEDVADGPWNP